MGIRGNGLLGQNGFGTGRLLYVTDLLNDSQDVLEFACGLAEKHGAQLEILHIIDPEQTSSNPDAQMGIQYSLESLARNLRNLRRNTQARLLFGHPEDVISRRAAETRAALVAISESCFLNRQAQNALVSRLSQTCTCPVVILSALSVMGMRNRSEMNLAFR